MKETQVIRTPDQQDQISRGHILLSHSRNLARELKRHGVPVQTLFVSTEGHGFYEEHNRRDYYTQLLGFLAEHLGGAPAAPKPKD